MHAYRIYVYSYEIYFCVVFICFVSDIIIYNLFLYVKFLIVFVLTRNIIKTFMINFTFLYAFMWDGCMMGLADMLKVKSGLLSMPYNVEEGTALKV